MAAVFLEQDEAGQRRLRFWQIMTDFYAEAFYGQITEMGGKERTDLYGRLLQRGQPILAYLGDYFKCMSHYHIPGLDSLGLPRWRTGRFSSRRNFLPRWRI